MGFKISDLAVQIGAAAIWLLMSAAAPGAEMLDRVLAVVSGDLILMSDVRAARTFGFVTVEGDDPGGQALTRLIDRALILAEVERFAPPEPESAAEPVSVFVARRYWPGSSWLVVGGVLSMRTLVTVADGALLPATSCTTTRSW